jgi:hypothetical protein
MNVRISRVLAALLIAVPLLGRADDRAGEWIAKARARCGDEAALNAVSSIHYSGTLEAVEKVPAKDDPAKTEDHLLKLGVEIIFQKPYQHRIVLRPEGDKGIEITALDDYDAWTRRTEVGKDDQFTLYDANRIKRLRANTWENLAFYHGIEKQGGHVEFLGDSDVDGTPCVTLEFIHSDEITFTRYFEKATGRLVKTVTDNKGEIREEGEMIVNGIRFPKKLINTLPDGQVRTITFDSIKVNEVIPEDQFAVPSFPAR